MKRKHVLQIVCIIFLSFSVPCINYPSWADPLFLPAVNYGAGVNPDNVAMGDLNNDGHPDLVIASHVGVSVLLGKGDGTFEAAVNYEAGALPIWVATGDLNNDGHLDLAVINPVLTGTVSVLLGNGDGTFKTAVDYAVGAYPYFVAVGDFNKDGHLDLVAANYGLNGAGNTISVLVGNGDGTFKTAVDYTVGRGPFVVAIGDLNGDGHPDLAVADDFSDTVSVLLGNGDGTFQTAVDYGVGTYPQFIAIGDLNGDGHPDIAVPNNGDTTVSVLINASPCTTPGTPILSSPSNGASSLSTTPVLSWDTVSNTTSYNVDVCSDSGCSSMVTSASGLTTTQWIISPALNKTTAYWWRVQANNACGSSPWSSTWSFATGSCFIATAAFGTPEQGKINVLRSFRDSYLLQSSTGNAFVTAYYKYSPPMADYIAERGWLRAVVRILLLPVIGFVSLLV